MAKKKLTNEEIVMDGYQALFKAATPSADFMQLINNCCKYIDMSGNIHNTDTPLTKEECITKGWRKDINYMDYELEEDVYEQIVQDKIKQHNLNPNDAEKFRFQMYLGCGPKTIPSNHKK